MAEMGNEFQSRTVLGCILANLTGFKVTNN